MSRLPRISGKEVLKALVNAGFIVKHIRGSHHYLRKEGFPRLVVVPVHGSKIVPPGTLSSILQQAGLNRDEFMDLL